MKKYRNRNRNPECVVMTGLEGVPIKNVIPTKKLKNVKSHENTKQ